MADRYSDVYPQPGAGRTLIDACYLHGRKRTVGATIVVNTFTAADRAFVCRLPSSCRLLPDSWIYWEATAGATGVTFGDANGAAALMAATSFVAANSKQLIAAIPVSGYQRRLWQMLGYAKDPRTELDLYLTFPAGSSNGADAAVFVDIEYATD